MKKLGYTDKDVESVIMKWARGLLSHAPYVKITPNEQKAIQKRGICLSLENGIVIRHAYLERMGN
jgi:hypothetical protein